MLINEFALRAVKVICGITFVLTGAGVISISSAVLLAGILQVAWHQAAELDAIYRHTLWAPYYREMGEGDEG